MLLTSKIFVFVEMGLKFVLKCLYIHSNLLMLLCFVTIRLDGERRQKKKFARVLCEEVCVHCVSEKLVARTK